MRRISDARHHVFKVELNRVSSCEEEAESSFSVRRSLFTRLTCVTPTQLLSMPMLVWLENTRRKCRVWESAARALPCKIRNAKTTPTFLNRLASVWMWTCVCVVHTNENQRIISCFSLFIFFSSFLRSTPKKPTRDKFFDCLFIHLHSTAWQQCYVFLQPTLCFDTQRRDGVGMKFFSTTAKRALSGGGYIYICLW